MTELRDQLLQYVDLTIYDRSPEELVDRALADAASKLPDWVPRKGNTEVVLIEAFSLVIAELVYAVNRIPAAVTEVLVKLYGIERSNGAAPVAQVTFPLVDDAGHTVPAGTHVRLDLADGTTLIFTTDADGVADPGEDSVTVDVTGTVATDVANGTPIGTVLTAIESSAYVEPPVVLAAAVSDGANPEDTTSYLNRAVQRFARLNDTLVLARHFQAAALDDVRVSRALAIDNHNGVAPANGHVAVAVAGDGGAALSGPVKAEIEATLEAKALANLDVHVIDPTITAVNVTTTVKKLPGYTDADVDASVTAVLAAYLDPDSWDWGATVRHNELIAHIDGAVGVDYVVTLTVPAADVALAGVAPLADLGVVAVTVT